MAIKITPAMLSPTFDGHSVLDGRFLIFPAKSGPVLVIGAGPNASEADKAIANQPRAFVDLAEATTWLGRQL